MCLLLSDITTDIYIETANFSLQTRHFQVGVGEHQGDPFPRPRRKGSSQGLENLRTPAGLSPEGGQTQSRRAGQTQGCSWGGSELRIHHHTAIPQTKPSSYKTCELLFDFFSHWPFIRKSIETFEEHCLQNDVKIDVTNHIVDVLEQIEYNRWTDRVITTRDITLPS